jgi:sulfate adenylyltransferase
MGQEDYLSVVNDMRLTDDIPWTIPVILRTKESLGTSPGDELLLVDGKDSPLAVMSFEEEYAIPRKDHASKVYGTEDQSHPGVANLYSLPDRAVAGKITGVFERNDESFPELTLEPKETRVLFREKGWSDVIAFQTRNAPHIGHEYVQKTGLAFADGLFVNPVLGKKKAGDFKDEVIVETYQALMRNYYPKNSAVLSVLHYEMQYAGPREAILHAIMRKNFGCNKIAIGRDHAGVGTFYAPYAAQEIFKEFPDLGIEPVFLREFYYCKKCEGIANERICPHGETDKLTFSGTELRKMFLAGKVPPKEFMRPEVASAVLRFEKPFVE